MTPRPVRSDPEILGGTPVFAGTRVPFQTDSASKMLAARVAASVVTC
ncbi:MAG TPA: DUF433 domain-containing protein [Thermoanaerobaculia bacterium]